MISDRVAVQNDFFYQPEESILHFKSQPILN